MNERGTRPSHFVSTLLHDSDNAILYCEFAYFHKKKKKVKKLL